MSDTEILCVKLGSFDECEQNNHPTGSDMGRESKSGRPHPRVNPTSEDLDIRSLVTSNSRENSEVANETARLVGN